jgi:hypothetical protein
MIVFLVVTGLGLWQSIVLMLATTITFFASINIWARAGMDWEQTDSQSTVIRAILYPYSGTPAVGSQELAITTVISTLYGGAGYNFGWYGSLYTVASSCKMAKLTGVNPRNVLKVAAVALFTSMLTSHIAQIAIVGTVGGARIPGQYVTSGHAWWAWGCFWTRTGPYPLADMASNIAFGFIFMVVMRLLYTRLLWLPDPLAMLPVWAPLTYHGLWFPALVIWVVKSLVLRIGGSKLYEEKVIPFAGGAAAGIALEMLIMVCSYYASIAIKL